MNDIWREQWMEAVRCTLAEFLSRPSDASEAALRHVLTGYRLVFESAPIHKRLKRECSNSGEISVNGLAAHFPDR